MKMIINRKQIIVGDQWIKILCNNCKKIKIKKFKKTTKKSWIFPLLQSDNLKFIKQYKHMMIDRLVILRIMNKFHHKIMIKIILNKKTIKILSLITQIRKFKNKNLNFLLDLIQIYRIKNMILFI